MIKDRFNTIIAFCLILCFMDMHASQEDHTGLTSYYYAFLDSMSRMAGFSNTPKVQGPFPPALQTYELLNQNPADPFVLTIGTSMSQTEITDNTINPEYLRRQLAFIAQKQKEPKSWLLERKGYVVRALPQYICQNCHVTIDPTLLDPSTVKKLISNLIWLDDKGLTISVCPTCQKTDLVESGYRNIEFSRSHWDCMVAQLQSLGVFDQKGSISGLPTNRLSIEIAGFLQKDSLAIDEKKLQDFTSFLARMKNPLVCLHHYTNPMAHAHMFEKESDIGLFAQYSVEFVKAYIGKKGEGELCICPMSQPVAFGIRVAHQQNLPPFTCSISKEEFLKNIAAANIASAKAMKGVCKEVKVLISHQYKPFKPLHGMTHVMYGLEKLVSYIADRIYNQSFIALFKDQQAYFDGIALSVYPSCYFDGTTPVQDNCSGILDPQGALESIVQIHRAFPTKDIYIVETGCNTADMTVKKKFIDMMLWVCKVARDMGIPIKMCALWGHANDPDYYYEWDRIGQSYFGYFDSFALKDPAGAMNESGRYIQEILKGA